MGIKRLTAFLCIFFSLIIISGCQHTNKIENQNSEGIINIVCTNFPQYDWVRHILGNKTDNVELTLLLNNGIDPHNYQPSIDDIIKISTCDLFIYVGGESDKWVDDVLKDAINTDMAVINLLDILGDAVKTEDIIEGMEKEGSEEEPEHDEHVWLSLKNTEAFCYIIVDELSSLDIDNAEEYKSNLASYISQIKTLDAQYQAVVNTGFVKILLFGGRFPFRYLVDDYGLSYYAAFPGCSAETEASFETIIYLSKKMDELNLHTIIITENAEQSIAKTIINNTKNKNQQILVLDSMQSVTLKSIQNGTTYLSIMESNLNVLKEAIK